MSERGPSSQRQIHRQILVTQHFSQLLIRFVVIDWIWSNHFHSSLPLTLFLSLITTNNVKKDEKWGYSTIGTIFFVNMLPTQILTIVTIKYDVIIITYDVITIKYDVCTIHFFIYIYIYIYIY
jgi:hypothetical protein